MIRVVTIAVSLCCAVSSAMAQDWAMDGMDPVSYRQENAAVPGRSDLVTVWRGMAWHFASEENRNMFESIPGAYAPGFGGLCVIALSEGRSEPGNPRYFAVIGHRTYFVRSAKARERLLADPQHILAEAKAAWARMNP